MSVPAALTAIVIILAIIALVVVGVVVLAGILILRLLRLERQIRAEAGHLRQRVRATMEDVGKTAHSVTSTVETWGSGARYAGLAAEAAAALLAWRRKSQGTTPQRRRVSRARMVGWAVPTGVMAWQVMRRIQKRRGRPGPSEPG